MRARKSYSPFYFIKKNEAIKDPLMILIQQYCLKTTLGLSSSTDKELQQKYTII